MDNSIIPISDAQAAMVEQALKTLQATGGAVREILGTTPEDLVALLGGNWLKVQRVENLARLFAKAEERLKRDGIKVKPASLSVGLPILEAGADESREELQDLWAALLAAAADPAREKSFRNSFIEVVKKMDPLDSSVLIAANKRNAPMSGGGRDSISAELQLSRDQVEVSIANLQKLELMVQLPTGSIGVSPLGREFLRVAKV